MQNLVNSEQRSWDTRNAYYQKRFNKQRGFSKNETLLGIVLYRTGSYKETRGRRRWVKRWWESDDFVPVEDGEETNTVEVSEPSDDSKTNT